MKGTTWCVNEPAGISLPKAAGAFLSAPVNGVSGRKSKPAPSKQSRRRVQRNGITTTPDGTSSWSWGGQVIVAGRARQWGGNATLSFTIYEGTSSEQGSQRILLRSASGWAGLTKNPIFPVPNQLQRNQSHDAPAS